MPSTGVVETVGGDAAGLAFAAGFDLSSVEQVVFLHEVGGGVKRENRVPSGVSVPDKSFRILGVNSQGMRVGAAFGRSFCAGDVKELSGIHIVSCHVAGPTHGGPEAFVIGLFDRVGAAGPLGIFEKALLVGFRVENGELVDANVNRINKTVGPSSRS